MDLQTFLANFDTIAEAPNGIPKLRSLILDLAVRGKLAPQNLEDEPLEKILKQVKLKKEKLVEGKKLRRDVQFPDIKDTEVSFEIPSSWTWVRLQDIALKITDGEHLSPNKASSGVPLLTAKNVLEQGLSFNNIQYISAKDAQKSRLRCDPEFGDVLICSRGTIGRTAIVDTIDLFCLMGSVILIKPSEAILGEYLKHYLSKESTRTLLQRMSGATAVKALYLKDVISCPIPLPSIAEQKRIIKKVDELMALCDRLQAAKQTRDNLRQKLRGSAINSLMKAETDEELKKGWAIVRDNWQTLSQKPEDVDDLRRSVLQLAMRGKLVSQSIDDENIDALLIKAEQYQPKYKPSEKDYVADTINDSYFTFYELPKSWKWLRLRELSSSMANGLYKPASFYSDEGIASIRMFNIQNGHLLLDQLKRINVTNEEYSTYQLAYGDIVVNRVNSRELVGKSAIVDVVNEPMVYEAMNIRVRLIPSVTFPHYINLVLLNGSSRKLFFNVAKQASGQASVSQPQVGSLPIPFPPLAEQKRIVAKVDELMQMCDRLEESLCQSQQRAEALAASAISQLAI
ncbi:restriction endonuclease subunit S [Leptolyngbya sp. FACHB-261]|uniref:restriction endonuclease subunit S n=1 Tax=Leptolyngbya sp. FACHB-261 TaxID=2692806 RepID=UPI00168620DF|nr:restriction endonuclease subunit S [Leptolyngbya sp. FACHB-261]MBD2100279.1 restriction endonuclease subunit S [Leptolyngbya sp. FACHB-261]